MLILCIIFFHELLITSKFDLQNEFIKKNLENHYNDCCQTVWIKVKPDIMSGLIWVQIVCKGHQQMDTGIRIPKIPRIFSKALKRPLTLIQVSPCHCSHLLLKCRVATNISHWLKVQKRHICKKSVFLLAFCFYYSFTLYYCAI